MTKPVDPLNNLTKMSVDIARRYLHSAVILDDEAEFPPANEEPNVLTPPEIGSSQGGDTESQPKTPDHSLNAKLLIDSFADQGLVCSVFKPSEGGQYAERIQNIATKADIVILDWTLFREAVSNPDDIGNETLKLIGDILQKDAEGNRDRSRLIAIYTAQPGLESIADKVGSWLEGTGHNVSRSGTTITSGRLRISVFSKSEVLVNDLPDLLITDFAAMIEGLLPNVAMSGLAALRESTHQLLGRFSASLDPGYLGHRVLLPDPQDAEDHLVFALGSEIMAILEDDRSGKHAGIEEARVWISEAPAKYDFDLSEPIQPPNGRSPESWYGDLLEFGIYGIDESEVYGLKGRLRREATEAFTKNAEDALMVNRRFQSLLSLKTGHSATPPQLKLGTIVSFIGPRGEDEYYICIQPKCDSTRLKNNTSFPLLKLLESEKVEEFVIPGKLADSWVNCRASNKPQDIRMVEFRPDAFPPGEVTGKMDGDECFFDSVDGRFKFHAQLKDEHAQRTANAIAAALSRPGPDDSEWLRILSNS